MVRFHPDSLSPRSDPNMKSSPARLKNPPAFHGCGVIRDSSEVPYSNPLSGLADHNNDVYELLGGETRQNFGATQQELSRTVSEGICHTASTFVPGRKLGGSGKPRWHFIKFSSKKKARDAARNAGKGKPIHDSNPTVGRPHFHPVDKDGVKIGDGTHYLYMGGRL